MKAIVTTRTDNTNVYGYVSVEPMTDNGLPVKEDQLPKRVQAMIHEQYPSEDHARKHRDEPAKLLRKLGWTVLNADGDPYFKAPAEWTRV